MKTFKKTTIYIENITEPLQGERYVESKTNPTDNTRQNPLQIHESSYSASFSGETSNSSVDLQEQFSEILYPNKLKLKLNVSD